MFSQIWKKYLPVIVILMKRANLGEQVLNMNHTDFARAAGGRKIRLSFSNLQINNGRINTLIDTSQLAKDLVALLQENELSKKLLRNQQFEFAMNNDFKLIIKNNTPAAIQEPAASSDEIAETKITD